MALGLQELVVELCGGINAEKKKTISERLGNPK